MDKQTIFYSWQSDDKQTKNFIKRHLERAIKAISDGLELSSRPTLDESTKGKLGAVDIPATILEKIDNCDVFIADLSFIDESEKRKIVNQNVMFELGYMMGKQGAGRVIMLFNSDYGEIKDLPFDISQKRVLPFSIQKDPDGKMLESTLINMLPAYLENAQLHQQLSKEEEIDLDNEEIQILKLYATIENVKRIIPSKTLGGYIINIPDIHDDKLLNKLIEQQGEQKFVANLDDLAEKGVLKMSFSSKGTPIYELAKNGFNVIEKLTSETEAN